MTAKVIHKSATEFRWWPSLVTKCPVSLPCFITSLLLTASFVFAILLLIYAFPVFCVLPLRVAPFNHSSPPDVHRQTQRSNSSRVLRLVKFLQTESNNSTENDLFSPLTFDPQLEGHTNTERSTSDATDTGSHFDSRKADRKSDRRSLEENMKQESVKSASNACKTCNKRRTGTEEIEAFTNYKYRHPVESSRLDALRKLKKPNSTSTGIHDKLLLKYQLDLLSNIIYDGIYWSKKLESMKPKGFGPEEDLAWIRRVNSSAVVDLKEGCGRMQNRLVVFDDTSMSCARHRQNTDQIQGELFSFQLGRILGISNLVPSTVSFGKDPLWNKVQNELHSAKWNVDKPVVLTKFIDDLTPAYIPSLFRSDKRHLHPLHEDIGSLTESELIELMQWSDLIVFDYLTANLDRIVNNLFNKQWNSEMMKRPAHNLLRSRKSGLLLFIDNESGLLHGYRLLNEYETFHRSLLDSLCIFRKTTAESIAALHKQGNVSKLLSDAFYKNGLDYKRVPFLPERNLKMLKHRIATVHRQIALCKSLYSRS